MLGTDTKDDLPAVGERGAKRIAVEVEAESFSGAARRLGLAKSVVSRRIGSLEDRLGTSLFHRTTRRLSLTETGHAYYERARNILADVVEAEEVARRLQSELRGTLKIAAPMSFGLLHLSAAVAEFLVVRTAGERVSGGSQTYTRKD
jgi:DNA-binding transcriptional LysR family regulator